MPMDFLRRIEDEAFRSPSVMRLISAMPLCSRLLDISMQLSRSLTPHRLQRMRLFFGLHRWDWLRWRS